ncbi:Putative F-box/LRR-repeat protein At3g28410 [Linum perenne]
MENKKTIESSTDMLSNLPDSIIHHILSFLDPKSVVRTSALSKRWEYTWIHGSILPFDSSSARSDSSYETYIRRILSLRSPSNLQKLYLTDYQKFKPKDYSIFVDVVKYAFDHDVQHLEIYLQKSRVHFERQPGYSFTDLFASTISQHRNLRSLSLGFIFINTGFRSLGFEMLKDLELHSCLFTTSKHDQVFDFFSGLPCLENLWLRSNDINDTMKTFSVSGLRLRTLDMSYNKFCRIAINAPNLKSFIFHNDYTLVEFTEIDLSSLDHADVSIEEDSFDTPEEFMEFAPYIISFFNGLDDDNNGFRKDDNKGADEGEEDNGEVDGNDGDEEEDEDEDEIEELVVDEAMNYLTRGSNPIVTYSRRTRND